MPGVGVVCFLTRNVSLGRASVSANVDIRQAGRETLWGWAAVEVEHLHSQHLVL